MSSPAVQLRSYSSGDLESLYEICLLTAASGGDGSSLYRKAPRSVGDYYAAPYAEFEPELITLLTDDAGVCGYVLGTSDTAAFEDWFEREWFPRMRKRYPAPAGPAADHTASDRIIRRFHEPLMRESRAIVSAYPAHLHIDILPRAQGQGNGRRLMDAFLLALQQRGVKGVHLGLGLRNHRALNFYTRFGFSELEKRGDPPHSMLMGLHLAPEVPAQ